MNRKKWVRFLVVVVVVVVIASMIRDAGIQSDRESTARIIAEYEQNVQNADSELRALEAEPIAFEGLKEIASLQTEIVKTSELLTELAPVLRSKDKVNTYSSASVDAFNSSVRTYNTNIRVYQSQMSELNGIVDRANKQYEIKIVTPASLDRASLTTDKKFLEMLGLATAPRLVPKATIEEINMGIALRSEKQKSLRNEWNSEAERINQMNRTISSLREEILKLYGTTFGGITVEEPKDVMTGNY
jgi:peptidoglycan hydrolase CwlO-like protein